MTEKQGSPSICGAIVFAGGDGENWHMGLGLHRLARMGHRYVTAIGLAVAATATPFAQALVAQGLSGASLIGTVGTPTGRPVSGANVALTELNTGVLHSFITDNRGRFAFESVPVGLYRIEARVIGLRPASSDSISLHLGDRMEIRLTLSAATERAKRQQAHIMTLNSCRNPAVQETDGRLA